ncbi:helix-turn-helix domain-containing protein [Chitinophaga sp. CF418]|uniref:helix-turn-helix domain-containing protein n=1 Tax=Chitinophaga sp. CF418 TaxID=1855287 RepID=UPI00091B9676|nr:helix-turn-helix transcriptional regulator [Chitinophaga sp. CF418]SHL87600.1 Transcriptional regulator, contains XRE-family HTH domain [Chitinophaga sp. CF418]
MTVGEKIRSLRKSMKLSQEQLAAELGVDRTNVSMWETDKAKPQLTSLKALTKFFNVGAAYFLDETDPAAIPPPGDKMNPIMAMVATLLDEVAIMKAEKLGISVRDAKLLIKQKSSLILDNLDSWLPDPQQ